MVKQRITQQVLHKRLERVESLIDECNPSAIEDMIKRLAKIERKLFLTKNMLTSEEATEFTGISISQLYKLTRTQMIPHWKPRGKMVYFDKKELEEWMRQNPVKVFNTTSQHVQKI